MHQHGALWHRLGGSPDIYFPLLPLGPHYHHQTWAGQMAAPYVSMVKGDDGTKMMQATLMDIFLRSGFLSNFFLSERSRLRDKALVSNRDLRCRD